MNIFNNFGKNEKISLDVTLTNCGQGVEKISCNGKNLKSLNQSDQKRLATIFALMSWELSSIRKGGKK